MMPLAYYITAHPYAGRGCTTRACLKESCVQLLHTSSSQKLPVTALSRSLATTPASIGSGRRGVASTTPVVTTGRRRSTPVATGSCCTAQVVREHGHLPTHGHQHTKQPCVRQSASRVWSYLARQRPSRPKQPEPAQPEPQPRPRPSRRRQPHRTPGPAPCPLAPPGRGTGRGRP